MLRSVIWMVLGSVLVAGCKDTRERSPDAGRVIADGGPLGCVSDVECFEGEFCAAGGFCQDLTDYEACIDSADCVTGDCIELTTTATFGAFCSFGCTADAECPPNRSFGAACYDPGGAFICFQLCDIDSDCEFGSYCTEVIRTDGFADFICIPDQM